MIKMNKKAVSLAACALVLTAGLSVKPAMAYFTASARLHGSIPVTIDDTRSSVTEEHGEGMVKVISVRNEEETPCFVRVAVIMPEGFSATWSGEGWRLLEDGFYYYDSIVNGTTIADGQKVYDTTSALNIDVDTANAIKTGEDTYADFNVIVIPESAKVLYHADGSTYADWEQKIHTAPELSEEGGNE